MATRQLGGRRSGAESKEVVATLRLPCQKHLQVLRNRQYISREALAMQEPLCQVRPVQQHISREALAFK